MKKKLLIAAGTVVAIPLLVLAGVVLFIDPIVGAGVRKAGSAALKVPVRLNHASIHFAGRAELVGLSISNPEGYSEPRAVAFDRFVSTLRPRELLHEVIHIDEVTVEKPELTLELVGTKSNLSVLMANLPKTDEKADVKSEGKKFLIRKMRIEKGVVRFRSDLLPGGAKTLSLPSMELDNLGTAEGGATTGEILKAILGRLGGAALEAGEGVLPAGLLQSFSSGLRDLSGRAVDEIKKKAEELKPKDLENKVKNLFDGKRRD